MDRVQVQPHHIEAAFADLRSELKRRLEEKGGLSFASTHEALGIVTEEFWELVEAVKKNDTKEVIKECLDLAVGTLFSVATAKAWTEEFKGAGEK